MSREDFERLQQLMLPIYVEEGLTDEKGYYIHNWDSERLEAKNQLVDFLLDEIVPTELRNVFDKERRNIVFMDKLIKIFRKSAA